MTPGLLHAGIRPARRQIASALLFLLRSLFGLAMALTAAGPLPAAAAEPAPSPGDYLAQGGWGRLRITGGAADRLGFSILTTGPNGHQCALDGDIRDAGAILQTLDPAKPCSLRFKAGPAGVEVSSADAAACRSFCGARAGFEGLYLKTSAACTPAAVRRTRADFKNHYDRKAFDAAQAALEPLLTDCATTLAWLETGWIRNDLALTHYRRGDPAACQRVLEPLRAEAQGRDEEIRNRLPPSDAERWLAVIRAARTNLKLCAGNPAR